MAVEPFIFISTGARNILYALDAEGTVWQLLTEEPGATWKKLTSVRTP